VCDKENESEKRGMMIGHCIGVLGRRLFHDIRDVSIFDMV
jgi:hypothetical protein